MATPVNSDTVRIDMDTALSAIGALVKYSETVSDQKELSRLNAIISLALHAWYALHTARSIEGQNPRYGPIEKQHERLDVFLDLSVEGYRKAQTLLPDLSVEAQGQRPLALELYEAIRAAEAIARYLELDLECAPDSTLHTSRGLDQ